MTQESLFHDALGKTDPAERAAFLDAACGADLKLRQEVEALLEAHQAPANPLDRSPVIALTTHEKPTQVYPGAGTAIGAVIAGRYTLEQKLGEGGMGEVWVARQTDPVNRRVAIKFIRAGMDTEGILARFDQERQALAIMDHPNIAKILDGGVTETGRPFFVMELVRGLPITRYCDQEKLTPRERLVLFAPICQGVQHAHQKGIIHRDIKPSNIIVGLVDGKPVPKIIDFGVAKAIGQRISKKSIHTEIGSLLGTLEYMSPEQADLTNLDIDTRTDVYALGVVLYELLTGTVPFTRKEVAEAGIVEMLMMIKEKEPQKPSTRISTLKELPNIAAHRRSDPASLQHLLMGELDWIIMKCLEKERSRRYDSPLSLAFDLERFLADQPVLAAPPSALYRIKKFVKRYRGQVAVASCLLLMLIGGVIATSIGMWMATKAEEKAKKSEAKAIEEADLHRALLQYLEEDLFRPIDPELRHALDIPLDQLITGRTLLERATKMVGQRFEDKPRIQAALRRTLGNALRSLGAFPEALSQFELAMKMSHDDDPLTLELHESLGAALHESGIVFEDMNQFKQAEKHLVEAVRIREQTLGVKDPATLRARFTLGSLERSMGKLTEAEKRLSLVLDDQKQVLPSKAPAIPRTMAILADVYHLQKRQQAAEKMYQDALAFCRNKLAPDDAQTLIALNNMAYYLRNTGRKEQAMKLYEELVPAATRVHHRDDPFLLFVKNNQAVCYWSLGNSVRAETLFQEVLEAALRITTPENKFVLALKQGMADVSFGSRDWSKATSRYEEIIKEFKKAFGTSHDDTWRVMENLAFCYYTTRKDELCLSVSTELLKFFSSARNLDSKRYYNVLYRAVDVLKRNNRTKDAEPLLQEALQIIPQQSAERGKVQKLLDQLQQEPRPKA